MSNPFNSKVAREHSCYGVYDGDTLHLQHENREASRDIRFVHSQLRSYILDPNFSCVGAKAAVNQNVYRFGLYNRMGAYSGSVGLCRDLYTFIQEREEMDSNFTTFIASFRYPSSTNDDQFERWLWRTLQLIHLNDSKYHKYDPAVSPDPEHPRFSFSVAETAFFVVGLHPGSSRLARRFTFPTLVFNPHEQFEILRENGVFESLKETIRENERDLQGCINPNVADYGQKSEAHQYSGRPVDDNWHPPFVPVCKGENP
jgi:FPC/CPF motif-containing protein YcgG